MYCKKTPNEIFFEIAPFTVGSVLLSNPCPNFIQILLKSSRNKKDLNDITAALFSVSFSQLPVAKKAPKTGQL